MLRFDVSSDVMLENLFFRFSSFSCASCFSLVLKFARIMTLSESPSVSFDAVFYSVIYLKMYVWCYGFPLKRMYFFGQFSFLHYHSQTLAAQTSRFSFQTILVSPVCSPLKIHPIHNFSDFKLLYLWIY